MNDTGDADDDLYDDEESYEGNGTKVDDDEPSGTQVIDDISSESEEESDTNKKDVDHFEDKSS